MKEATAALRPNAVMDAMLNDACLWGWSDDCPVEEQRTELELLVTEEDCAAPTADEECDLGMAPTYQDVTLQLPIPCLTTTDGCELDRGAGILPAVAEAEPLGVEQATAPFNDPCWWDEGCVSFA